jgi:Zn-finger protein
MDGVLIGDSTDCSLYHTTRNINTIKKNIHTLIDGNKEVGLEANTELTKYECMLLSRHQNAG